jgi:hypothetical protein
MLDDKNIVQAACDELVALDWLREYEPVSLTGRPPRSEYFINPKIKGVRGSISFKELPFVPLFKSKFEIQK